MSLVKNKLTPARLNHDKYTILKSLIGSGSISANPKYISPVVMKALKELTALGICRLDMTGSSGKGVDPGDKKGRYRLVVAKAQDARDLADQLEKK